jgi:hypothetical protein
VGGEKKNPSTMIIIAMPVHVTLFGYGFHLFFFLWCFLLCFFVIYFCKDSGKFLEMIISMRPIFVRLFELIIIMPVFVYGGVKEIFSYNFYK